MLLEVGDTVTRMVTGTIPMDLTVVRIDDDLIYCGNPESGIGMGGWLSSDGDFPGWTFDRTYGYEIDEELGWGIQEDGSVLTGSYLVLPNTKAPHETISPSEFVKHKLVSAARHLMDNGDEAA